MAIMDSLIVSKVFLIDVQALICVMFWEGLASSLIIFTSKDHVKFFRGEQLIEKAITFRLIRSLGYFLLLYRGIFPDLVSSTLANVLLLLAFYLDAHVLLQTMKLSSEKLKRYGRLVFVMFSLLYVVADLFFEKANIRVVIASLGILMTFAPVVFQCMFGKKSRNLYRSFLWPYLLLIITTVPRAIVGITNKEYTLLETDVLQSMFYGFLLLKAFFCTLFLFVIFLSKSANEIEDLARDPLTGLNNRKSFNEQATEVFKRRQRTQGLFGVFFLDIDLFKNINDQWGHDKGDEILVAVADALQCSVDVKDICCRHGGDEFIICTTIDNVKIGEKIGKRLQEKIHNIDLVPGHRITSSIGFAYGVPKESECFADYITKADEAMYLSKRSGRDRLTVIRMEEIF
ncbi:diguanylate cyclase (GGDEF)-like protein [Lachnospiraceae bacterium PFB1-21]